MYYMISPFIWSTFDQSAILHFIVCWISLLNHYAYGYCILSYWIVLYCIVLYCIELYCIVLYCIVLYCIVLYCIVLYCIVLFLIVLYCIVLYCIVLFCIVFDCIVFDNIPWFDMYVVVDDDDNEADIYDTTDHHDENDIDFFWLYVAWCIWIWYIKVLKCSKWHTYIISWWYVLSNNITDMFCFNTYIRMVIQLCIGLLMTGKRWLWKRFWITELAWIWGIEWVDGSYQM